MPISSHQENCIYNAMRTKRRAKPRHRGFIKIMRPEVVLKMLQKMGIEITERTLQNYVKDELIPMPERRSAGRGKGKLTDYAESTPAEFKTSWLLINHGRFRATRKDVSIARKKALAAKDDSLAGMSLIFNQQIPDYESILAVHWLNNYNHVLTEFEQIKQ